MKLNRVYAASILLLFIAACAMQTNIAPAAVAQNETIKIGAIFMLTGVGSNWGTNSQQGIELAIKEINGDGGIDGKFLEVIYEDNQGDNPAAAVTALQKLSAQDVQIVLGPNWSPSGIATAPIACDEKILMISPSLGVADFNEKCDYLFNLWPHDELLSESLGKYLYAQGYRKIAILGSGQVWEETQALAVRKEFESSGGQVVAFQLPQAGEQDFRTDALKIKESDPEAVVVQYSFQHLAAKQLRQIGVIAPFYAVLTDDERIKGAEGALEETVVITSFTPTREFVDKFAAEYNAQPDIGSDTSYDAVMLLAKAMKETHSTDPTTLKDYINGLKDYEGVSGKLTFDGKGGVAKPQKMMMIKNNKLSPLISS